MSIPLEAYTAQGLLTGSVVADGRLVDMLSSFSSVLVGSALMSPFEGPTQRSTGWTTVEVDDLLAVVATPETVTPFHAAWHAITVDLGPYRIRGELPALPGFDPAKALARPNGSFILLARVTVELRLEGLDAGHEEHAYLWINRYAVDAVVSDLDLGFFFPGALDPRAQHAIA
jgi:hypothetical protein